MHPPSMLLPPCHTPYPVTREAEDFIGFVLFYFFLNTQQRAQEVGGENLLTSRVLDQLQQQVESLKGIELVFSFDL